MNKKRWKKNEIDFLIENYSFLGSKECSKKLNRSIYSITTKAHILSLKLNKKKLSKIRSKASKKNINNFKNDLLNNITPDFAYILGFIWGDGHVNKKTNNVCVSCVSEDIDEIKDIFFKTGDWLLYTYKQKKYKEQKTITITNIQLHSFLIKNNYLNKSIKSPIKILKIIPTKLHNYFLLGLIDSDGCFYWNEKNKQRQFSITGSYNQEWIGVEDLLKNIQLFNYKIVRRKNKTNSFSSYLRITKKSDIVKLGEYVYSQNNYGLKRKKEKYLKMIN